MFILAVLWTLLGFGAGAAILDIVSRLLRLARADSSAGYHGSDPWGPGDY